MSTARRTLLICLGLTGLLLLGVGTLVALSWDTVSQNVRESLAAQDQRAQATLFRLGEVMSIGAALEERYRSNPDMDYSTGPDGRILSISFSDYDMPRGATAEGHARDIAVFAIGETSKWEQVDAVHVQFGNFSRRRVVESGSRTASFSFALKELISDQPLS